MTKRDKLELLWIPLMPFIFTVCLVWWVFDNLEEQVRLIRKWLKDLRHHTKEARKARF